ncbi:MAG: N-acetylmuramoyl-L-alanine amidase [Bacteroidales bacterium]
MKTNIFILSAIAVSMITVTNVNAQNINDIKVVRGKTDTVTTASHIIVGTTKPGSEVYINDNKVKHYKTGSFGTELKLVEGDNPVVIKALYGGTQSEFKFSVFYKVSQPAARDGLPGAYPNPVVITKQGAYLNYGAGQDRLGGAKINYLAEGIKMELLDSVGNLYKVRLSENNYSYIPKDFVSRTPFGTKPPFSLTGSWSVSNTGKADKVIVSLEQRQPYTVKQERDPNRIVVDIYGAACNSNWITQYLDLKVIDYVDLQQIQPDVFRVIINLKNKYSWGYSVDYTGNSLAIIVKHAPEPTIKGLVIGIDAGHGGSASGAVSPSGFQEKEQNLAMAYMLKQELEKRGAKVVMSRKDDSDMAMAERLSVFKNENIDLLISIHCNAGGNPLVNGGTSTYYRYIEYRDLAESILKRLVKIDGVKNFGLVGNFNFSLNSPTNFPSVLVETLFMSSLPDEEKITDNVFQKEMMVQVAKGLEDYLKKVKHGF